MVEKNTENMEENTNAGRSGYECSKWAQWTGQIPNQLISAQAFALPIFCLLYSDQVKVISRAYRDETHGTVIHSKMQKTKS